MSHPERATQREQGHQQYPNTCEQSTHIQTKQRKAEKKQYTFFPFRKSDSPHVLVPGHIWKSILSITSIRIGFVLFVVLGVTWFECRVFTDEAGVQQDDVRAQDGLDHLQDTGVFGQVHRPWILKMNIVEAVLSVI